MKIEAPVRLLPKTLAARYCGVPVSRFASICPKRPIRLAEADRLKWDIKDLDEWIDSMKAHRVEKTAEEMLDDL